jgi:AcrR family transcriptional regulator
LARARNARGTGEKLRAELFAASEAILDETGDPAKVTVRGVASAVGVAPNAVYLHFADRDALLAEIAIARYQVCTSRLRAVTDGIDDPLEALYAGHEEYCRLALEHPGHYRLLFHGLVAPSDRVLLDRVATASLAYFQTCIDACQRCLDAGVLRAPDAVALAGAVWSLEHGWCEINLTGDLARAVSASPREALRLLLNAPTSSGRAASGS